MATNQLFKRSYNQRRILNLFSGLVFPMFLCWVASMVNGWRCVRFRKPATPNHSKIFQSCSTILHTNVCRGRLFTHLSLFHVHCERRVARRVLFHICLVMAINLSIGYICTYIPIDLCINRYPIALFFIPLTGFCFSLYLLSRSHFAHTIIRLWSLHTSNFSRVCAPNIDMFGHNYCLYIAQS